MKSAGLRLSLNANNYQTFTSLSRTASAVVFSALFLPVLKMEQNSFVKRCLSLVLLAVGYLIASFYGVYFVYTFVRRWMKDTSVRFWEVKPRELPPPCLTDPALGNHVHVQIKVVVNNAYRLG